MSAVNPKVLADLRALQGGILAELIDSFLVDALRHLVALREACAAKDARTLERYAQTLKRSSGNLGAQVLSRLCVDLQTAAHAADWTKAATALSALDAEFLAVKAELLAEKSRV